MATDWDALDYSDPCALLAKLQPAYYRLLAGEADEEIEATDGRRVRLARASIPRLERVIARLKSECAAKQGNRSRFAMPGRFR